MNPTPEERSLVERLESADHYLYSVEEYDYTKEAEAIREAIAIVEQMEWLEKQAANNNEVLLFSLPDGTFAICAHSAEDNYEGPTLTAAITAAMEASE